MDVLDVEDVVDMGNVVNMDDVLDVDVEGNDASVETDEAELAMIVLPDSKADVEARQNASLFDNLYNGC